MAICVLMVKILNKYSLRILVYNLVLVKQRNVSIHRYIGCLYEIEIQTFKKYGCLIGQKH